MIFSAALFCNTTFHLPAVHPGSQIAARVESLENEIQNVFWSTEIVNVFFKIYMVFLVFSIFEKFLKNDFFGPQFDNGL